MNLQARLEAAMNAARQGDHEGALREYLWFHEHVLDHHPGYYGVRLSFALSAWVELAEAYPPARDALIHTRDSKACRLLRGEGGRETFDEVEAINSHLGNRRATYELFRQLRETQPGMADACADLAWETAAALDISFIRAELRGPRAELEDELSAMFAERVALLLRVLSRVGEPGEAAALRARVLGAVEDPSVRNLVRNHLDSAP